MGLGARGQDWCALESNSSRIAIQCDDSHDMGHASTLSISGSCKARVRRKFSDSHLLQPGKHERRGDQELTMQGRGSRCQCCPVMGTGKTAHVLGERVRSRLYALACHRQQWSAPLLHWSR